MKICPRCKMTVDAHCECPVCKNNITDVPYSEKRSERYVFNKYILPYLLKKQWFSIICIIVFLIRIIINHSNINWYAFVCSALLAVCCVLHSLFKNGITEVMSWKYTQDYMDTVHNITKYGSGLLSIIFSFLW